MFPVYLCRFCFYLTLFQLGGLHDRHLVGMLLVLILWDLIYLSVWQSIFPLTTKIKELPVSFNETTLDYE